MHSHIAALCVLVSQMRESWVLKCSIQALGMGVQGAAWHSLGAGVEPKAVQVIQQSNIQRS